MKLTIDNDDINALVEIIAKKVVERIKGCVPEKTSEAVKEAKTEAKKEEEPLYKQEDIRKAVMAFTRESPDNLATTKEILSDLGLTRLTQLKGELIAQFAEKFREAGGKF